MKKKNKKKLFKYIFFLKISFYKNYLRHLYNRAIEIIFYYNLNYIKVIKDYNINSYQLKNLKIICSRSFLNYFSNTTYQHESLNFSEKTIKIKQKKIKIIYLTSDGIRIHLNRINKLKNKFIIIMGNSDLTIDNKTYGISKLINNKMLIKIYSQNINIDHEKVIQLPIGVDFHSSFYYNFITKNKIFPFTSQKKLIETIKLKTDKKFLIYCDFHFAMNSKRETCKKKLIKPLCFFPPKRVNQKIAWEKIRKHQFIACPEGNGVDTHRIWESLLLGTIPIIKDNFLAPLYSKLPVIIVKDWSQINKNYLKKQLKIIKSKKYDFSILFMRYWINKIYQKKNISEKIKYNLFLSRFFKNNIKCF